VSEANATDRGRRKTLIGVVVSNKMDKTAVVSVEERKAHSLYHKIVRRTKRYKAHDPNNNAVLGDIVRIEETRPISKDKHWRIVQTLTRGNVAEIAPREIGVPEEAIPVPHPPVVATPVAEPETTELASDVAEETATEPEAAGTTTAEAEATELAADVAEETEPEASAEATDETEAGEEKETSA
jgi:small subunit ribosomal protein S17